MSPGDAAPLRSDEPLLEVVELVKHFPVRRGLGRVVGQVRAVDGISFRVARGETLALVGESGCGKTTAARALLRLVEPDGGAVLYRAEPGGPAVDLLALSARELRARRRELGIVFQDPDASLNPRLSVGDIVGEGLRAHRIARGAELERRIGALLEQVGLDPAARARFPHEFSGGQRQRIGIARALATAPRFVVLDEALSALDVSVRSQVLNLLADLRRARELTLLFIAHDLSLVRHLADRVAVMHLGRIVEIGTTEEVFERPAHPYTEVLLSAIPALDPRERRARIVLSGEPPAPSAPPSGCRFRTRCPRAEARCAESDPGFTPLSPSHQAACHLLDPARPVN